MVRDISLEEGKRLSVGRTKENDVAIDDQSISKAHASLLLNKEGKLIVADTGSTNGTFVRGERIAYGKAVEIAEGDSLLFGLVKVDVKFSPKAPVEVAPTKAYRVGDLEFTSRTDNQGGNPTEVSPEPRSDSTKSTVPTGRVSASNTADSGPPPTVASIPVKPELLTPVAKPESHQSPDVAPQPALTETKIEVDKEKQDWEV